MRFNIQQTHTPAQRLHFLTWKGNGFATHPNDGVDAGRFEDAYFVLTEGLYKHVAREQWSFNWNTQTILPMADRAMNGEKKLDVSGGKLLGDSFLLARVCVCSKPFR
jgi:hypothetical protein